LTKDSTNNIPINIAIEEWLVWESGMEDVLATTAAMQHDPVLFATAYYGLEWTNYMEELMSLNDNMVTVVNECERNTGMHLIMVAAMGKNSDLDTIYSLLRGGPEMVVVMGKYFKAKCKKRKRQTNAEPLFSG
jgi:hypothetical protein